MRGKRLKYFSNKNIPHEHCPHFSPRHFYFCPLALGVATALAKNIVDTAVSAGDFNTLVAAVSEAGLVDTLKGPGPFTVLAPSDEAFAKIPARTVENLSKPENKDQLISILTYHVVPGRVLASEVGKTASLTAVQGGTLRVTMTEDRETMTEGVHINDATVLVADIEASNGVIHVIDNVVLRN